MPHTVAEALSKAPRTVLWLSGAVLGLWAIYALIFLTTGATDVSRAALTAAVNVLPLAALSVVVQRTLERLGTHRSLGVQILAHAALAAAFSLTWYGAVVLGLAVVRGFETGQFAIEGFRGPALTWQSFQGLCLYAVVAALSHALRRAPATSELTPNPADRYLVKVDDALLPVRVADIVCLQGAHDYIQLTTLQGTHLVRHGLSDFGARLDPGCFIRIHRSIVVNLDHVAKVEPIGAGKFRVLLSNGASHTSSRAGAQALRGLIL